MFVPASSPKFLVKASTLPADAFIVDLEDAVAPSAKEAARENVAGFLRSGGIPGKDVFVRVNHLNTPYAPRPRPSPRDGIPSSSAQRGLVVHATQVGSPRRGAHRGLAQPGWHRPPQGGERRRGAWKPGGDAVGSHSCPPDSPLLLHVVSFPPNASSARYAS